MYEAVYTPREDSFLMLKTATKYFREGISLLDMGCGSGIIAMAAARAGCDVVAADINPAAVKLVKQHSSKAGVNIKVVHSDLFSGVKGKFDVIVFNPPYLPPSSGDVHLSDTEAIATIAGKNCEVIVKFLEQARHFLKSNGVILLLLSSLTDSIVEKTIAEHYVKRVVAKQRLFFETLYVYELRLKAEAKV